MNHLKNIDPEIYEAIKNEIKREQEKIELIASENFASANILEAQGSVLTNKYAEGYPGARWYGGCEYVDVVEELAIERAKKLFGAEHVNVQPHSGTQANMAVYFATLDVGDTFMAMDLACGGHLSHGHKKNFSGRFYNAVWYGVSKKTETLDYDEILDVATKVRPKLIMAGACAYPRIIDFEKFREIADKVRAIFVVDMAHIAGLIASGLHPNPVEYADIVTTTTHKTLRGPRAGMILCTKRFAKQIDREVFPGIQGGPLMHVIAAKAVAFKEALEPEFKTYQKNVVTNAKSLARALADFGFRIVSGGTDNHLILVELTDLNITGKEASELLDQANITVNKNLIPFDKLSPAKTSGIRLGTPAVTTRGMGKAEMQKVASIINKVLRAKGDEKILQEAKIESKELTGKFPLYSELI